MNISLDYTDRHITHTHIIISGSKSESNRLLILQEFINDFKLDNLSDSDDTKYLKKALASNNKIIDIGHAGTAMRFLTAFFSIKEGSDIILTGSERMRNRPIKILVEALQSLGADIEYLEKSGYPPLKIKGQKLINNKVKIQGNVSSQYISALLLVAPFLQNGLEIELLGKTTSIPYIKMTLNLLDKIGVLYSWEENIIKIKPQKKLKPKTIVVESDWSSASYFYSLIALSRSGTTVSLSYFNKDSLQGDSSLIEIYKHFGIETKFNNNTINLIKKNIELKSLVLNLVNYPDLAQTIVVTCFGLGIACDLTGLHTLKIKETDRLVALKNELEKLGAQVEITDKSLHLKTGDIINKNIAIDTYNDHRMAMAFAPLALKVPITINNAQVVTKSFISFWKDIEKVLN